MSIRPLHKTLLMVVPIYALALFATAFAIQLCWWRISVPRRQLAAIASLFLAVDVAGCIGFAVLGVGPAIAGPFFLLLTFVLAASLSAAYVVLFTALEADSPSLTILGIIARAGAAGISRADLAREMEQHNYVQERIQQMINDGMVYVTPSGLRLAGQGLWLTTLVLLYRRFLGLDHVGG